MRLSDSVSLSVYMKILKKRCLYIFGKTFYKWDQFSYELCVCDLGGLGGVLNGPPPTPSPASMSKFPSGGKNMENNVFVFFL